MYFYNFYYLVVQFLSMCVVDESITLQCQKLATPDGLYQLPLHHGLFLIMPLFGTVVQYLWGLLKDL